MKQRLKIKDLFIVALYGVKARRGRAALTSIGIGIGIAAIVAVTGISASGRADLLATLESLLQFDPRFVQKFCIYESQKYLNF